MKKLLPLILLFVGAGAGVGAGLFLRPDPVAEAVAGEEATDGEVKPAAKAEKKAAEPAKDGEEGTEPEYVKMSNQFVVPIVENERIASLVVMSLSVEVVAGQKDTIYEREPKLRDSFLRELFNHANRGGFSGAFTSLEKMDPLRMALREVAQRDLGEILQDVLILEIARQDY